MRGGLAALVCFCLTAGGCTATRLAPSSGAPAPLPTAAFAHTDTAATDSMTCVIRHRLDSLLDNEIFERTQLGLYVYDLTTDAPLYAHHIRQQMRPASNQKIVTAVAALALLGPHYRYETQVFRRGEVEDSVLRGDLCVKAAFDPLLGREDVRELARKIAESGIRTVEGDLLTDVSLKDTLRWGWGWCWDDDMPDLLPDLCHRKPTLGRALADALTEAGVRLAGKPRRQRFDRTEAVLLAACTRTIDQVLMPTMKKSDNLCAESLFYHIGAASGKPYAGRKTAAERVNAFIRGLGLRPDHYQVADGSGVSLYNYLTPQLLVALLRHAYRHDDIYRHLLPALPVAGEDGTLGKRMRGTSAQGNVHAKTGTVEGVSSLSGYATAPNGHRLAFSIINQGIRHTSTGRHFQDRVCRALTEP